jgi:hypothetical protein
MPISISGDQTLALVIGLFALVGFIRGWRKMGVVFVGTLLTGIVLIQDDTRLIKTMNNLPKIVDLVLDTKYGASPMIQRRQRTLLAAGHPGSGGGHLLGTQRYAGPEQRH